MMRLGASSSATGAMRSVKSALLPSAGAELPCIGIPDCICAGRNFAALVPKAAAPPSFMKALRLTTPQHSDEFTDANPLTPRRCTQSQNENAAESRAEDLNALKPKTLLLKNCVGLYRRVPACTPTRLHGLCARCFHRIQRPP